MALSHIKKALVHKNLQSIPADYNECYGFRMTHSQCLEKGCAQDLIIALRLIEEAFIHEVLHSFPADCGRCH